MYEDEKQRIWLMSATARNHCPKVEFLWHLKLNYNILQQEDSGWQTAAKAKTAGKVTEKNFIKSQTRSFETIEEKMQTILIMQNVSGLLNLQNIPISTPTNIFPCKNTLKDSSTIVLRLDV